MNFKKYYYFYKNNEITTANDIISTLYKSKEIDALINTVIEQHNRVDFKQELFLKILEIPEKRLIEIYNTGGLPLYCYRMVWNIDSRIRILKLTTGIPNVSEITEKHIYPACEEMEFRIKKETNEDKAIHEFKNIDNHFSTDYYRKLVTEVVTAGGMRKLSRKTGIPVSSISTAVKKVRNYIKEKIK